jgi:hypothetical protein
MMRMNSQIDISGILSTMRVPTLVIHRTDDAAINVEMVAISQSTFRARA